MAFIRGLFKRTFLKIPRTFPLVFCFAVCTFTPKQIPLLGKNLDEWRSFRIGFCAVSHTHSPLGLFIYRLCIYFMLLWMCNCTALHICCIINAPYLARRGNSNPSGPHIQNTECEPEMYSATAHRLLRLPNYDLSDAEYLQRLINNLTVSFIANK